LFRYCEGVIDLDAEIRTLAKAAHHDPPQREGTERRE
jgi:hypothetical protein